MAESSSPIDRILALDPGLRLGWAVGDGKCIITCTHNLFEVAGNTGRVLACLEAWLADMVSEHRPTLIVYEAPVKFGGGWQLRAGMAAIIRLVAYRSDVAVIEVSPSAIKKHATGNGRADKEAMIEAATAKRWSAVNEHEADALWLLDYARKNIVVEEVA